MSKNHIYPPSESQLELELELELELYLEIFHFSSCTISNLYTTASW